MPNIMKIFGYNIYFWSNENEPLEPVHVHVSKTPHANATKVWISRDGSCQRADDNPEIPKKDLKKILHTIDEFSEEIIAEWEAHFHEATFFDEQDHSLSR